MPNDMAVSGRRTAPVVRSEAEWRSIMADFERSGMTQREFCEAGGLSLKTFQNWRGRLGASACAGSFVELPPPDGGWDVELDLGGGVVLRLRRNG